MSEFGKAKSEAWTVGVSENRAAWRQWRRNHFRVLVPWLAASALIAVVMIGGIWLIASLSNSDQEIYLSFLGTDSPGAVILSVLINNSLVLLLHLLVCVAAYLAQRSVPLQAKHLSGVNRFVHDHMGPIAMVVVTLMVLYSLSFQTWEIGHALREIANQLNISPGAVLLRVAPHAFVELTAIFLPLAACFLLGRKQQWNSLLAAAFLCAIVALPMIVVAALWEGLMASSLF